jgi:hypothetical protein
MPAKAGTQGKRRAVTLDPRFRGGDERMGIICLIRTTSGANQQRQGDTDDTVRESRVDQKGAVELAAPEFRTMSEELKGNSLADVLEKLEKGKIGHRAAMDWLDVKSYDALVEIMHTNGRLMPGHQPMRVAPETRELVRRIFRPPTPTR